MRFATATASYKQTMDFEAQQMLIKRVQNVIVNYALAYSHLLFRLNWSGI